MLPILTLLSVTLTRAALGGTLAFTLSLHWSLILPAALMDGLFGLGAGVRAIRGSRQEMRWSLSELFVRVVLTLAVLPYWLGDLWTRWHYGWTVGRIGVLLLWFAPVLLGRLAIAPVLAPWRGPQVERARSLFLGVGVTTLVTALCLAGLLRRGSPPLLAAISVGGLLTAGVVVRARLRRQWLVAIGAAQVHTHRPLGRFALVAFVLAGAFDVACWHGTGFVPVYQRYGDLWPEPHYVAESATIEWRAPQLDPPSQLWVGWQVRPGRFESACLGPARAPRCW